MLWQLLFTVLASLCGYIWWISSGKAHKHACESSPVLSAAPYAAADADQKQCDYSSSHNEDDVKSTANKPSLSSALQKPEAAESSSGGISSEHISWETLPCGCRRRLDRQQGSATRPDTDWRVEQGFDETLADHMEVCPRAPVVCPLCRATVWRSVDERHRPRSAALSSHLRRCDRYVILAENRHKCMQYFYSDGGFCVSRLFYHAASLSHATDVPANVLTSAALPSALLDVLPQDTFVEKKAVPNLNHEAPLSCWESRLLPRHSAQLHHVCSSTDDGYCECYGLSRSEKRHWGLHDVREEQKHSSDDHKSDEKRGDADWRRLDDEWRSTAVEQSEWKPLATRMDAALNKCVERVKQAQQHPELWESWAPSAPYVSPYPRLACPTGVRTERALIKCPRCDHRIELDFQTSLVLLTRSVEADGNPTLESSDLQRIAHFIESIHSCVATKPYSYASPSEIQDAMLRRHVARASSKRRTFEDVEQVKNLLLNGADASFSMPSLVMPPELYSTVEHIYERTHAALGVHLIRDISALVLDYARRHITTYRTTLHIPIRQECPGANVDANVDADVDVDANTDAGIPVPVPLSRLHLSGRR